MELTKDYIHRISSSIVRPLYKYHLMEPYGEKIREIGLSAIPPKVLDVFNDKSCYGYIKRTSNISVGIKNGGSLPHAYFNSPIPFTGESVILDPNVPLHNEAISLIVEMNNAESEAKKLQEELYKAMIDLGTAERIIKAFPFTEKFFKENPPQTINDLSELNDKIVNALNQSN